MVDDLRPLFLEWRRPRILQIAACNGQVIRDIDPAASCSN
jgi:hypothetical protein